MNWLFAFIAFIFIYAIYNLVNYFRFPTIEKHLFYNYSNDNSEKMSAMTYKTQIVNYIKYAGVKDKHIPVTQSLGYGYIASANASLFDNITSSRQDIAQTALQALLEAKGNYWSRFINSFNPFYWLRIILFIPKYLFSYLGIKEENIAVKIFQITYWLIGIVFTFLISVFPEEIKSFLYSLFNIS